MEKFHKVTAKIASRFAKYKLKCKTRFRNASNNTFSVNPKPHIRLNRANRCQAETPKPFWGRQSRKVHRSFQTKLLMIAISDAATLLGITQQASMRESQRMNRTNISTTSPLKPIRQYWINLLNVMSMARMEMKGKYEQRATTLEQVRSTLL